MPVIPRNLGNTSLSSLSFHTASESESDSRPLVDIGRWVSSDIFETPNITLTDLPREPFHEETAKDLSDNTAALKVMKKISSINLGDPYENKHYYRFEQAGRILNLNRAWDALSVGVRIQAISFQAYQKEGEWHLKEMAETQIKSISDLIHLEIS